MFHLPTSKESCYFYVFNINNLKKIRLKMVIYVSLLYKALFLSLCNLQCSEQHFEGLPFVGAGYMLEKKKHEKNTLLTPTDLRAKKGEINKLCSTILLVI